MRRDQWLRIASAVESRRPSGRHVTSKCRLARLVALKALAHFAGLDRFEGIEVAHAMAAQATLQARAGGLGTDEFVGDSQQAIEQQRAAQLPTTRSFAGMKVV